MPRPDCCSPAANISAALALIWSISTKTRPLYAPLRRPETFRVGSLPLRSRNSPKGRRPPFPRRSIKIDRGSRPVSLHPLINVLHRIRFAGLIVIYPIQNTIFRANAQRQSVISARLEPLVLARKCNLMCEVVHTTQ